MADGGNKVVLGLFGNLTRCDVAVHCDEPRLVIFRLYIFEADLKWSAVVRRDFPGHATLRTLLQRLTAHLKAAHVVVSDKVRHFALAPGIDIGAPADKHLFGGLVAIENVIVFRAEHDDLILDQLQRVIECRFRDAFAGLRHIRRDNGDLAQFFFGARNWNNGTLRPGNRAIILIDLHWTVPRLARPH